MPASDLSIAAGYAKQHYLGWIVDQYNLAAPLHYRLAKKSIEVAGLNLVAQVPLDYQHNEGIGFRAEGGTFPTAGRRRSQYTNIGLSYLYGSIQLTGQSIKATRNSAQSYASVLSHEITGIVQNSKLEINAMSYGDGTARRANIVTTGLTAAQVITPTTDITVDTAELLAVPMRVDGFTALTGGVQAIDSLELTVVDRARNIVRFSANWTVPTPLPANIFLFREDSRGLAPMGLLGITDGPDAAGLFTTTTLQGINGSTAGNEFWRGNVLSHPTPGTLRSLSLDLMQQAFELGELRAGGRTSAIITTYGLRRSYQNLLVADRRFVRTLTLDGGFSAVEYSGGGEAVPIMVDRMSQPNRIYFIDERTLSYYNAGPPDFLDYSGSILRQSGSTDQYDATLAYYFNLATTRRAANTVLRDVN